MTDQRQTVKVTAKASGDLMFDRSAVTLGCALLLLVAHTCFGLNVHFRPRLSVAALSVELFTLTCFWLRALVSIVRGWTDPSARILRFSSVGALLLAFWPVIMLLTISLLPPNPD